VCAGADDVCGRSACQQRNGHWSRHHQQVHRQPRGCQRDEQRPTPDHDPHSLMRALVRVNGHRRPPRKRDDEGMGDPG
jgi:hypothetical protein